MYETGAPPAPPPLPPVDAFLVVDQNAPTLPPSAARIDHAANLLPAPVRQQDRPTAVPQYDAVTAILPGGPPPGTVTYRLRGTETSRDR